MLSPLALPCLPNHEVVYTRMSSASVFIEAKRRLSVNDHHNHSRRHPHHHHHHRHCSVWSDVIVLPFMAAKEDNSPTYNLLGNWTTGLSF